MDLIKDFAVDAKRVRDGVWVDMNTREVIEEDAIDASVQAVKLARAGNRKFVQAYTDKMLKKGKRGAAKDSDADLKARAEVLAETVILDWRNLTANSEPFPYSKANVVKIVLDETYEDFFEFLMGLAQDVSYFKTEKHEDIVKNSSGS